MAILGNDWPGLRPHLEVALGETVARGQTLFTDRMHRDVHFVSPVHGIVEDISYGPRRTLDTLVVRLSRNDQQYTMDNFDSNRPRELLLSSGLWPAFRTRPFGIIPAPDAAPDAIVVNAVQRLPQAPDPAVVLDTCRDEFHLGCKLLTRLTRGRVHICQAPGGPIGPTHERIHYASFSGTVAAGLAGTQIDRLCRGMPVWSVGYQDVVAIGQLISTCEYRADRVISVTGPGVTQSRLLRVPLGARIADLTDMAGKRAFSTPTGSSRVSDFLGRFDDQVTLVLDDGANPRRGRRNGHSAAIPTLALERAVAVGIPSIPLLRALSVGDADGAKKLGCLALLEEDLAAATHRCTSGVNYSHCLRDVLTELMADAA